MDNKSTRRQFMTQLGTAATLVAVGAPRVHAANDRIQVGFIGVGARGSSLLQATLARDDVEVVAITDAYDIWRQRAVNWCKAKKPEVSSHIRFEEMLGKQNLDAVVIATPDHIHAPAMLTALKAGLDVYIEKPMTLTWQEAQRVRDAAIVNGAVVQVGTQLRSTNMYQKARQLVQKGRIGQLVEVQVNRHMKGGMVTYNAPPAEATEKNVHWDVFLRNTQAYPFELRRFFQWRLFKEYSNGVVGDLMLHHLDVCHYIADCGMPRRIMSTGDILHFDDGRTRPDTVSVLADYPEGFQFNYTTTLINDHFGIHERYLGTEGTIEIRNMGAMTVFANGAKENITSGGINMPGHLDDFFTNVRTRGATIAPVEVGFNGAACCDMAVLSQQTGESAKWDPLTQQVYV